MPRGGGGLDAGAGTPLRPGPWWESPPRPRDERPLAVGVEAARAEDEGAAEDDFFRDAGVFAP